MEKIIFKLKKASLFLFLIFFLSVNLQFAKENVISIQGKEGEPFFDRSGNLNIVYLTSYGEMRLLTKEKDKVKITDIKNNYYRNDILSIRIKKDWLGKRWIIWEERAVEKSDIYLAQLKNDTLLNQTCLTADIKGFNFSPRINFSSANDLFITWVNYHREQNKIMVKNVSANQTWQINSYSGLDPQLLIDRTGKIWLFWVGQFRNHDEILYKVFERGQWGETLSLNKFPDVPHITPSAALDNYGFLHVVWSAYDGEDYELYYSYWNGNKWSLEEKITTNSNTADSFPCIYMFYGDIPAVAWIKYSEGKHEVWWTYKRGKEWNREIKVSGSEDITSPPKIISSENKTWILWQSQNQTKAVLINNYRLQEQFYPKRNKLTPVFTSLALNNNKYIGFGDSITYGIINSSAAPGKGYVPRLENLIKNNINSSSTVLNRGKGGEYTSGGLSRINSVINSDQARTIFLMEGTNDIKNTSVSIDTAAYNLEQMAGICLNFNMKVFLSTIIPRQQWAGIIQDRIYALNGRITSIASSPNIHFVDIFNAFYNYPGGWTTLYSDITHPNETGYQIMAQTWYNALKIAVPPSIEINKTSLVFRGEITLTELLPKEFKLRNSGGGKLVYDISTNKDWISVSPASGDSRGEWDIIEVTVDISDLPYGLHEGEVTVTAINTANSPQKVDIDLFIELPPLYPPSNFQGEKKENRSLSLVEYINILTWEATDQNEVSIEKYKIYLIEDEGHTLIKEFSSDTFKYQIRGVEKDKVYKYGITTLDSYKRESAFAYTEIK